jgi:hypothetical protein
MAGAGFHSIANLNIHETATGVAKGSRTASQGPGPDPSGAATGRKTPRPEQRTDNTKSGDATGSPEQEEREGVQAGGQREEQQRGSGQRGGDGGGGGRGDQQPRKQTLKILYSNVQSLPGKLNEIEAVLQDLEPDIVLFTETRCNTSLTNAMLNIDGYNFQNDLEWTGQIQQMV